MTDNPTKELGWLLLELIGHRQRIDQAREEEVAGARVICIDIPTEGERYVTEYYGGSAIYALRPISDEIARKYHAARIQARRADRARRSS